MQPDIQGMELRRLQRHKQRNEAPMSALGPELLGFFKDSERRQKKLGSISDSWSRLIPEMYLEHCSLEGFQAGTLKVIVDSSSHLYELKQLLLSGLQKQLLIACKSAGLRKISLKRGRWYNGDGNDRRVQF